MSNILVFACLLTVVLAARVGLKHRPRKLSITIPEKYPARYRVLRFLGSGADARVYNATCVYTGTPVALKRYHRHSPTKSLYHEVEMHRAIRNSHLPRDRIVNLLDTAGLPVNPHTRACFPLYCEMIFELLGPDLQVVAGQLFSLALDLRRKIIFDITAAISQLHDIGICHNDIKVNLFALLTLHSWRI